MARLVPTAGNTRVRRAVPVHPSMPMTLYALLLTAFAEIDHFLRSQSLDVAFRKHVVRCLLCFFTAPFCNCKTKSVQVPASTVFYDGVALYKHRQGRAHNELAQCWGRASSTKLRPEGEFPKSGSERGLCRNGDEATSSENPCGLGRAAGRGTRCTCPGKEASSAQRLSPRARTQRGDSVGSFRARGTFAVVCASQHCGQPNPGGWADDGGVNGKLCPGCAPCRSGRPLHTTSMHRASWTGTSMFMAASATLSPTRVPVSCQTWAMARSRGNAREASTPDVEHAARWSPYASRFIEHAAAGATAWA